MCLSGKPGPPSSQQHQAFMHEIRRTHRCLFARTCLQVSLEMDEESEDEVDALAQMYDPDCSADGTFRFVLLRELWASAR